MKTFNIKERSYFEETKLNETLPLLRVSTRRKFFLPKSRVSIKTQILLTFEPLVSGILTIFVSFFLSAYHLPGCTFSEVLTNTVFQGTEF